MDHHHRGRRGRGRPPLRGRRGRGRPPLGERGRGRGRLGGAGFRQLREIEIPEGEDIVSRIENYALQEGVTTVFINNAIGIVSNLEVEGRGIINAGAYQIEALTGVWSDFHFNGDHFLVNVTVRDMDGEHIQIRGNSRFLLSANSIRVFVEIIY